MEEAFSQIKPERLAGVGVGGGRLPVSLVVAIAEVLQTGAALRVFFDQISGCSCRAGQADRRHRDTGQVRDRVAEGVGDAPLEQDDLPGLGDVQH
jgi:hypothetical protein